MDLTCIPQLGTIFPGTPTGLLNAALNGHDVSCKIVEIPDDEYTGLIEFGNLFWRQWLVYDHSCASITEQMRSISWFVRSW